MGYAAMFGVLCKGRRARRPQGFWFLSQPALFWPGASIHPSVRPSHSPPRLRQAPLKHTALKTLEKSSGCEGAPGFLTSSHDVGWGKVMPCFAGKAK